MLKQLKITLTTLLFLTLYSCSKPDETSIIEKILVSDNFIKTEVDGYNSDSIVTQTNMASIEYFSNGNTRISVYRDESNKIRWWRKEIDSKTVNLAEVHPKTGQIMGKLNFNEGKIHGKVKYYYDDGRIRSSGQFKNGVRYGSWMNYARDGSLIYTTVYKNGKEESKILIE